MARWGIPREQDLNLIYSRLEWCLITRLLINVSGNASVHEYWDIV
jgi:hypothetical protein